MLLLLRVLFALHLLGALAHGAVANSEPQPQPAVRAAVTLQVGVSKANAPARTAANTASAPIPMQQQLVPLSAKQNRASWGNDSPASGKHFQPTDSRPFRLLSCASGKYLCADGSGCCSSGTICGTGYNGCSSTSCCSGGGGSSVSGSCAASTPYYCSADNLCYGAPSSSQHFCGSSAHCTYDSLCSSPGGGGSSSSTTDADSSSSSGPSTVEIGGGVGGVVLFIIICVGLYYCCRSNNSAPETGTIIKTSAAITNAMVDSVQMANILPQKE
jgi:hypothetical protein